MIGQRFSRPISTSKSFYWRRGDNDGTSAARSGCPQLLLDRDKRAIIRIVSEEPKIEYPALLEKAELTRKQKRTVQRFLDKEGIN